MTNQKSREKMPRERYKLYRAAALVITFPIEITEEEYDSFRDYIYSEFPVSITEQPTPDKVIIIMPEGMVPKIENVKKFFKEFAGIDIIANYEDYDIYVERR